jgi:hypothetical protein
MTYLRNLAVLLATSLPFAMSAGCTTDNTSSTAQLIECNATTSGPTGCHAVTSDDHAAGTCVDRDEDGNGEAHDAEDASDDHAGGGSGTSTDDDGDGTADSQDSDDDNDGVGDDRDCDELPGQDGDDSTDSSGSGA